MNIVGSKFNELLAADVEKFRRALQGDEGDEQRKKVEAFINAAFAEHLGDKWSIQPNQLWNVEVNYTDGGKVSARFRAIEESEWRVKPE